MEKIKKNKYFKIWSFMAIASFQTFFVSRLGAIFFLVGKIIRVLFYFLFIVILLNRTKALVGYSLWQVVLFYLTFNFIDATTQMLFREVYRFRQTVISGDFDFILIKPINSLFRSLFGWTDFLDFATLLPLVIAIFYVVYKLGNISWINILLYAFLVTNALFIAASFHIIVLSLGILSTEIDNAIMIYRDVTGMGKFPVNIYLEPVRSIITFALPVGVMMSFPADVLLGKLNIFLVVYAFGVGIILFALSLKLWKFALRFYTSASS